MLHIDGGSAEALRACAAVAAALLAFMTMMVTARVAGRIPATIAGLTLATVGSSPFIESFTLSGELLAAVVAGASMLAFVLYLNRGALRWLILAGLLTGCAVLVKQSAFDAGAAAVVGKLVRHGADDRELVGRLEDRQGPQEAVPLEDEGEQYERRYRRP